MVWSLWKIVGDSSKKNQNNTIHRVIIYYDPTTPLLGIKLKKLKAASERDVYEYHNSKAEILWLSSAVFMVQLSLTSVHNYWKNHSSNYMNLCLQTDVSAF